MSEHPRVSVLIPQRGRPALTLRAVDAVRGSTYPGELELLVFDDGSEEGPGAVGALEGVRLVVSSEQVGFGPANNRLAEVASGELLLLLNNDTYLAPTALELLVDRLLAEPPHSAVSPQFRSFDGRVLELGSFLGPSGDGWQLFRGSSPPASLLRRTFSCHYASAACLLVWRRDFLELGGFDPDYAPAYYEDADLCLRLRETGGRIVVEPAAVVYHVEGATAGRRPSASNAKRFQVRNRGRFAQRWAGRLRELPPLDVGAALRHALGAEDRYLVLFVLAEFLQADQSGGHARIWREIEALLDDDGFSVALWAEHSMDCERYSSRLEERGIAWFGSQSASRWPLERATPQLSSLEDLLQLGVWDAVITESFDTAERFGPLVRQHAPTAPLITDCVALLHRQFERGLAVSAALPAALEVPREREIAAYARADAILAASESDAEAIRSDLPRATEILTFDVGVYPPVASNGDQIRGSLSFLGNFLHPPNVDAVEWWLREVAPEIDRMSTRPLRLRVIGSCADSVLERHAKCDSLDIVGWIPRLEEELSRCRVFVAPLRYGAGTKDKITMAMRFGIPTVTTSIGAESMPSSLVEALEVHDEPCAIARTVASLMADDRRWRKAAARTRRAAKEAWLRQRETQRRLPRWMREVIARGRVR